MKIAKEDNFNHGSLVWFDEGKEYEAYFLHSPDGLDNVNRYLSIP